MGAFFPKAVQLEHLLDDDSLLLVNNQALLRVELVAVRHDAADPGAAPGLLLHTDLGALDDGRVLKLGEHTEHLEHHLPGGIGGV